MESLFAVLFLVSLVYSQEPKEFIVAPASLAEAPYPEWAHHHWVWLSNDRANQSSMIEYAMEYLKHDIQVGAVDLDSGWSTGYNNFIFDPNKYPDPDDMIQTFHSLNISVILWATSMIDTDSSNYQDAHDNGYLLRQQQAFVLSAYAKRCSYLNPPGENPVRNGVDEEAILSWWHGHGGLLDYTNPKAVEWWHDQLQNVFVYGIDGWKCDGTDPYVLEIIGSHGKGGYVSRKDYSNAYYSDFFDYTRKVFGKDTLIMSRPVDALGNVLYLDYSPQRVVLSGWVGDQDPTFKGLENALKRYLQSAWAGYPNFGSDIGGYRSGDGTLGPTKELFIRWAQLGSFSPLMENGGNKEHRPWAFDNETLNIYRKFVDIHYQLVPYLLSVGTKAIETNVSSITPLAPHQSFINKVEDEFFPSTYNYMLGDVILVCPIISQPPKVTVHFPKPGNGSSKWVYWFDESKLYSTGDKVTITDTSLDEYTVFIATNKVLPLQGNKGRRREKGWDLKWLLFLSSDRRVGDSFQMRQSHGFGMIASYRWINSSCIEFNITAHKSLHSYVQIKSRDFKFLNVLELQIGTRAGGQNYNFIPNNAGPKTGLSTKFIQNKGEMSTVSFFPQKNKQKLGHSILVVLQKVGQ